MAFLALATGLSAGQKPVRAVSIARAHALQPSEGVYAYARVSPSGRHLAYASESRDRPEESRQTVNIIDLESGRVLFREAGLDAYWSPDGERVIYLSKRDGVPAVSIWRQKTGEVVRNVIRADVGDYFSWGSDAGTDVVLTIKNNYFMLNKDKVTSEVRQIPACEGIGVGARPLLSRDARKVSTFVGNLIVVRNLVDCSSVIPTGIYGGKADFSWDGRFLATHVPRSTGTGYDIHIIDLRERTKRVITTHLPGSSLFPSWTRDNRVSFRYDGPDFRGFMMATDVFAVAAEPIRAMAAATAPMASDGVPAADGPMLLMLWAPWSAHSPWALRELQAAVPELRSMGVQVRIGLEPASWPQDAASMLSDYRIQLPSVTIAPGTFMQTPGVNQIPAFVTFDRGRQVGYQLGARDRREIIEWVRKSHDRLR